MKFKMKFFRFYPKFLGLIYFIGVTLVSDLVE